MFAERLIKTFRAMLDKRIKPDEHWTDLIYPILLTYNSKLVHSATEVTPDDARKKSNELMIYINMKMTATHNRRYPELNVGDTVKNQKKKLCDKRHASKKINEI